MPQVIAVFMFYGKPCLFLHVFSDYSRNKVMIMFSVVRDSGARMTRSAINHSVKDGGWLGLNAARGGGCF